VGLVRATLGLYLGPGVWSEQTYEVAGAQLCVLASEPFDPASYVLAPE
jgi:hypothetical protein